MKVRLAHVPNPDIRGGEICDNGYWSKMRREGAMVVNVNSLREAAQTCGQYIGLNDLGSGNWAGGQIMDDDGNEIARVSFNGRIWAPDGSEIINDPEWIEEPPDESDKLCDCGDPDCSRITGHAVEEP